MEVHILFLTLIFSRLICPSCLMFGKHVGDEVIEPEQAIAHVNDRIE